MSYNILVRFPDEIRADLSASAQAHDRSINWIVRAAVAEFLARQEPTPERARSASLAGDVPLAPTFSARREARAASATRC